MNEPTGNAGDAGLNVPPVIQSSAPTFPNIIDLLIGLAIVWTADLVFGIGVLAASGFDLEQARPLALLVTTLLSNGCMVLASYYFACRKYHQTFIQGLVLSRVSPKTLIASVVIGIVGALIGSALIGHFGEGKSIMSKLASTKEGLAVICLIGVLVPPFEEIYYRGFIWPILQRKIGAKWAVAVVTVWFGMVHAFQLAGDWIGVLVVLLMGFIWTMQRHLTGSLVPSLITHWTYNTCLIGISIGQVLSGQVELK